MSLRPESSVDASLHTEQVGCVLTHSDLDVQCIIASVQDGAAGATAVFIGTTRNSFKGKSVTRLEYQAYSALAIKTMAAVAQHAITGASRSEHHTQNSVQPIIKCTVHHRLGSVPIGEPSIVIAVSSPHRKEAFVACEAILEDIKRTVQIWKREYYAGEDESTAEWKANA